MKQYNWLDVSDAIMDESFREQSLLEIGRDYGLPTHNLEQIEQLVFNTYQQIFGVEEQ